MGVNLLPISVVCTVASFVGLQCWAQASLEKLKLDGSIGESYIHSGNVSHAVDLLLTSGITISLLANFVFNVFLLIILCLKSIFFVKLSSSETRKVAERLVNYLVYKAAFLPLILPPTLFQAATWSTWVTLLCTLKMFQALARDRLERLNASPSATPWTYFRVYSVLLLVLSVDIVWMRVCMLIYKSLGSTVFLLLFFEPLSIAFETLQAIMVHGFQLLDIWSRHSVENNTSCERSPLLEKLEAGALSEWKGTLVRNVGFFLDVMTLLTALCHHFNIWWFHGMAFHIVDAVIFLNTRALGGAIIKRIRGFIKLSKALHTLHGALPDATPEELEAYDDECAICREPMAKAKKLSCNHLFHLACLRSWLDQGLSEVYSCPTCRRPLFTGGPATNTAPSHTGNNEQLARQISSGLERSATTGPVGGAFADPTQIHPWRGTGLDPNWSNHPRAGQGPDGTGPSTDAMRSAGLSRVQMMMRHLAAVSETYAQTALEDAAWSLFPMAHPQTLPGGGSAATTAPPTPQAAATTSLRFAGRNGGGLRFRNNAATAAAASPIVNDSISHILAMADTVREVLPNIPDEIIFQDLQRTNSVNVTVNNLIQM